MSAQGSPYISSTVTQKLSVSNIFYASAIVFLVYQEFALLQLLSAIQSGKLCWRTLSTYEFVDTLLQCVKE
jgi:hypothetical protein